MSWQQIKALSEKRAAILKEARAILTTAEQRTDNTDLTTEERAKFDELTARAEPIAGDVARLEKLYNIEGAAKADDRIGRGPIGDHRQADDPSESRALRRDESAVDYLRARAAGDSESPNVGFGYLMRAMAVGARNEDERRALASGTDSAGGYTIPTTLAGQFIDALRPRTAVIASGANVVPLTGSRMGFAAIATDPTPAWRAESATVATSDPTFALKQFSPKSLAVLVKVPRELLQDSINIDQALTAAFTGAMAVELDRAALVGSGSSNQPTGIFNTSGILSVSMGTNGDQLESYDTLLDATYQLASNNAGDPTGAIMHPRTFTTIEKLKDGEGQLMPRPKSIEALPFRQTTSMPINQTQGTASTASSIIAGVWSDLWIGIRSEMRIEVLKETYAENLQYGFICHLRADVQCARPKSFVKVVGIIP